MPRLRRKNYNGQPCPWCGKLLDFAAYNPSDVLTHTEVLDCPWCYKQIIVIPRLEYSFSTFIPTPHEEET